MKDVATTNCLGIHNVIFMRTLYTYSFFSKFRKVIESPNPAKASSAMNEILFARKSKWRNLCKGFRASVGIVWMLLSPKRRYCKFSENNVI